MKKTLIALAVAASAAVSGSAMAVFSPGPASGNVAIGGNLIPDVSVNPWEAEIGSEVSGLNGEYALKNANVNIPVMKDIPFLGIRTRTAEPFQGGAGIAPQVNYGDAVDFSSALNGVGVLTLDVKKKDDSTKIGFMTVPFYGAAGYSASLKDGSSAPVTGSLYASRSGDAFFGGIPSSNSQVDSDPAANITRLNAANIANFNEQQANTRQNTRTPFTNKGMMYSAYYGSGILSGNSIHITLDATPAQAVEWVASLPVTVSYQ